MAVKRIEVPVKWETHGDEDQPPNVYWVSDKYDGPYRGYFPSEAQAQSYEKYKGKPDQIPGLKQAAEASKGRAYPEYVWQGEEQVPTGRWYVSSWEGEEIKKTIVSPSDISYIKGDTYYDEQIGDWATPDLPVSTGKSVIDQAMADPLSWVARNTNWSGLSTGGDFSALDEQMKFLKDNKYDLSSIPNQGAVKHYNVTKQILDQGTTGKWSGAGYGSPVENAKVMAGMLTNIGVNDIKDFGKFNGVVGRQLHNVTLKDPADPSKGYVYQEIAGDEFTGRTLDVPKDVQVRDVHVGYTPEDSYIFKQADIPVYGETFGNKVTKQPFVDTQRYNRAHGNIFSGTYIGHGRTGFGVQFAGDGTPYFYTQFGGDTSSMADIAPIISFLAVIPTPLQPFAAAANALIALDSGNTLGALASLAGIPGVSEAVGAAGLANVASAIKTANQVVNVVNAIETGNVMALATAVGGALGAGSMQIGDTGLTVSDAMKAVNLVKAIESENPTAIFNAAVSFGTAPNIQKTLNSPTTTLDAEGQKVADVVPPNFVADLVDPSSEHFIGNAEQLLGTTLAEAPNNVGTLESAVADLQNSDSKYLSGSSQESPFGADTVAGTGSNLGDVATGLPSTDLAGPAATNTADVVVPGADALQDLIDNSLGSGTQVADLGGLGNLPSFNPDPFGITQADNIPLEVPEAAPTVADTQAADSSAADAQPTAPIGGLPTSSEAATTEAQAPSGGLDAVAQEVAQETTDTTGGLPVDNVVTTPAGGLPDAVEVGSPAAPDTPIVSDDSATDRGVAEDTGVPGSPAAPDAGVTAADKVDEALAATEPTPAPVGGLPTTEGESGDASAVVAEADSTTPTGGLPVTNEVAGTGTEADTTTTLTDLLDTGADEGGNDGGEGDGATVSTGPQAATGPVTEDTAKRQADEFGRYLDDLTNPADTPTYANQDLQISQDNLDSFDKNLTDIVDNQGGLTSQWQQVGSDSVLVLDDGSGIVLTEDGDTLPLSTDDVKQMVDNKILNTADSGYVEATGGTGNLPGGSGPAKEVKTPATTGGLPVTLPGITTKTPVTTTPVTTTPATSAASNPFGMNWLDTTPQLLTAAKSDKQGPIKMAQLRQLYGSLTPEMQSVFADQGIGAPEDDMQMPAFATGGTTQTAQSLMDSLTPKFASSPKFLEAAPVTQPQSRLGALRHLKNPKSAPQQPAGMAQGGLPTKYSEAAPQGHKPEFITGVTGYYAQGGGTGQSDDIPAMLHDGDYVIDADAVAAFGDGSSKAGAQVLSQFQSRIPFKDDGAAKGKPVAAKIADGEYVFPSAFVTALGRGDNKQGAKILDAMRANLRQHKRSAPTSKIPPKAKSPLDYLKTVKG